MQTEEKCAGYIQLVFFDDATNETVTIVDDKPVSAETCERLTGKPIAQLIADGRAKLGAELAEYRREAA